MTSMGFDLLALRDRDLEQTLAPGVKGYKVETAEAIYVPLVIAENPGNGNVSRFLDWLPRDQTWRFPCVISVQLRGMLQRRGFTEVREYADYLQEWVGVYERKAER